MTERRKNRRLIDHDLAVLSWENGAGCAKQLGNVEQVSENGLSVTVGKALPLSTNVTVSYEGNQQLGIVERCEARVPGYLLKIGLPAESETPTLHSSVLLPIQQGEKPRPERQ